MKLFIAYLSIATQAIMADGLRPPPSAAADADDSPVLRTSGPTSGTTASDEDEAHLHPKQTEGYADLIASATKPGSISSGTIGECFHAVVVISHREGRGGIIG